MSNLLYDYLTESPLFVENYIDNNFEKFSDKDIERELLNYREYSLSRRNDLLEEISPSENDISILTEAYSSFLPDDQLLKQLSLYMDRIIVNDPLFSLTDLPSEFDKTHYKFLGFDKERINRGKLVKAINYMKYITPMVSSRVLKFIPLSYIHENPNKMVMKYSENYFSDVLPEEILKWFHEKIKVSSLYKGDKGWYCPDKDKLDLCRGIMMEFPEYSGKNGIYHLLEQEILSYDEETRIASFKQSLPEEPPDMELFKGWVYQSINQYSKNVFDSLFDELQHSSFLNCNYLTTSPFISELLNQNFNNNSSFDSSIANLVMNIDIPVLNSVSLENLMKIRDNEGEAFRTFRIDLSNKLKELRLVDDPHELKIKLENISYELTDVQINKITKTLSSIKRSLIGDAAIMSASLATTIQTGGLSLLGAAVALSKGVKDVLDYYSKVKERPAYFLWKLSKLK